MALPVTCASRPPGRGKPFSSPDHPRALRAQVSLSHLPLGTMQGQAGPLLGRVGASEGMGHPLCTAQQRSDPGPPHQPPASAPSAPCVVKVMGVPRIQGLGFGSHPSQMCDLRCPWARLQCLWSRQVRVPLGVFSGGLNEVISPGCSLGSGVCQGQCQHGVTPLGAHPSLGPSSQCSPSPHPPRRQPH